MVLLWSEDSNESLTSEPGISQGSKASEEIFSTTEGISPSTRYITVPTGTWTTCQKSIFDKLRNFP